MKNYTKCLSFQRVCCRHFLSLFIVFLSSHVSPGPSDFQNMRPGLQYQGWPMAKFKKVILPAFPCSGLPRSVLFWMKFGSLIINFMSTCRLSMFPILMRQNKNDIDIEKRPKKNLSETIVAMLWRRISAYVLSYFNWTIDLRYRNNNCYKSSNELSALRYWKIGNVVERTIVQQLKFTVVSNEFLHFLTLKHIVITLNNIKCIW